MNDNWHRGLLRSLATAIEPKCYLELGLGSTPVLTDIAQYCTRAYGVDRSVTPADVPENAHVFTMTTDEFFKERGAHIEPPDLVFVDADHSKEQVVKDLVNISKICAENCIVVLHDTHPMNASFTCDGFCSTSYMVPPLLEWDHVTIPRHPGATILRMKPAGLS